MQSRRWFDLINGKFLVGHEQDFDLGTGVTVIVAKEGAVGGVSVRGGAPGTRETDLLKPMNMVQNIHSVVLSGGSAFGLEASSGVMRYLHELGIGFQAGNHIVPIVTQAVIFDLNYKGFAYPGINMGYTAAAGAQTDNFASGFIGAGTGATIGKALGSENSSKGGLGIAHLKLKDGVEIAAIIVVNAFGDVFDNNGKFLSGIKNEDGISTVDLLLRDSNSYDFSGQNTTIGCIMTNAKLNKEMVNKLADTAHNGLALNIRPVHTAFDGDTVFALSSNEIETDFLTLQTACVEVVRKAIVNSVSG